MPCTARWIVGFVAFLTACGSAATSLGPSVNSVAGNRGSAVVSSDTTWPKDPLTIDSARVEGDSLIVAVSHGGGCALHSYQLVVGTAWMESFPVQAPARLSHDAHSDVCKALLRREVRVNLTPVAATYRVAYRQEHGTVSLHLAGSSALLWYRF